MKYISLLAQGISMSLALLFAPSAFASFSDVSTGGEGYSSSILNLEQTGIVAGFPDGSFRPDQNLTRAEFTKILLLAKYSKDDILACNDASFPDVGSDAWYFPYICFAKTNAVVSGYDNGEFRPNEPISYAEAAKITVNVLVTPTDQAAADEWWSPFTAILEQKGANPTTIETATDVISRGEMAYIVSQIIGVIPVAPTSEPVPSITAADIENAVFESGDETELKFLTEEQKSELDDAAVVKQDAVPRSVQNFAVTWSDADVASKIPSLPASVPVYLLVRPTDSSIFTLVKNLASALNLKGSVVRMDNSHYAVANIATGDYYLFFDLFHLTFTAEGLNIPVSGTGADAVRGTLVGVAGMPPFVDQGSEEKDSDGATWYRFTAADLPLTLVSLYPATDDSVFTPGKTGTIDVKIDENNSIIEIRSSIPNIDILSDAFTASSEEIAVKLAAGTFKLGDVNLQYPGALSLEDKRMFFDTTAQENVSITNATLSRMECGYLLETDESVQSLLAPVCIAHGQGEVNGFSVIFRGVVSIVK